MIQISFFVADREGEVARRHWPVVPNIGDGVFLHELMGSLRIVEIGYGDMVDGADNPIAGELAVAIRGTLIEDDIPDTQQAGTVTVGSPVSIYVASVEAIVNKLSTARAALYEAKFAIEQHCEPDFEPLVRSIITALDATTDEAADQEHETRKKVEALEAEVLSLRQQLARAHHAANRG